MAPPSETLASLYHDIYPGIDPSKYIGHNKGKVVFITGASKGLGLASARAFAQTGASVFISARSTAALQQAKRDIEAEFGVQVGYATIDVTDQESVKSGVDDAVKRFGKIDIVISNAGGSTTHTPIGQADVGEWWKTIELNLKGSFLVMRYTIVELEKTRGHIVFVGSAGAQMRIPGDSPYNISKHAYNRLAEWVHIDHGDNGVKAYSIHPGAVMTDPVVAFVKEKPEYRFFIVDTAELGAWTEVRLTSGSEDWLSGRYYDSTWGFDAVEALKDKIVENDALKNRLALPGL